MAALWVMPDISPLWEGSDDRWKDSRSSLSMQGCWKKPVPILDSLFSFSEALLGGMIFSYLISKSVPLTAWFAEQTPLPWEDPYAP